ncbi:MAG: glycoside hydrolase family 43 protein [Opitutales bacterium]
MTSDFLDTNGEFINAHGGGMLWHEGTYYWYGECRPAGPSTLNAQIGISCYASTDLVQWENHGAVLRVSDEPGHDLEAGCKIERPKATFCEQTGKFVLWWHHDLKGLGHLGALAGVATADTPTGPFEFIRTFRPSNLMFRDCTLFKDDDGTAYLVFATDDNANLAIAELDSTYLEPTAKTIKCFPGRYMEAPCVFKRNGLYYLIASDCSSWLPNEARSAVAPSLFGPWHELGNPCLGEDAEITFGAQSTYVQPIVGQEDAYLFMADRWRPDALEQSTYLWLPLEFRKTVPHWPDRPFLRQKP